MDSNKKTTLSGESTDVENNAPGDNLKTVPVSTQINQNCTPDSLTTGLCTVQPVESSDSKYTEELKDLKRKVAYYKELLGLTCERQTEEGAEGTRKSNPDERSSKLSAEMELMRCHDTIRKYLKKATEVDGLRGYVYGIVFKDNLVLTGTSESCSEWWNEVVKFEEAAPAAIKGSQNGATEN